MFKTDFFFSASAAAFFFSALALTSFSSIFNSLLALGLNLVSKLIKIGLADLPLKNSSQVRAGWSPIVSG